MELTITYEHDSQLMNETIHVDNTESAVFSIVGQYLLRADIPSRLAVTDETGTFKAAYDLKKRGTFVKNGRRMPSLFVQEAAYADYNNQIQPSIYDEKYLTCINPEGNNYKFYRLIPQNISGHTVAIDVEYGSIDSDTCEPRRVQQPYESRMFWIRYYEKLSKGYTDQTNIYCKAKIATRSNSNSDHSPKTVNGMVYQMLMRYAKHHVEESLAQPQMLTKAQVKAARREFNKLCEMKTLRGFNTHLVKLIGYSPRNIGSRSLGNAHLQSLMPVYPLGSHPDKDSLQKEFSRIINREEQLLLAMEAVVAGMDPVMTKAKEEESFERYGIHVSEATQQQKEEVYQYLPTSLRSRVKAIYSVKPEEQEQRFEAYCKKNHIEKVRKLWHGSVNENWASILQNSLQIRPTAANGRMFGDGLYFAPSPDKSWGYTSAYGTRWARGNSNTAFMGLYKTAYGNPWMVTGWGGRYSQSSVHNNGYDCVHATSANTGLRADEIIFYDNDAICLNYLVEFAG